RATATVGGLAPSGWRNVPAVPQATSFDVVGSHPPAPEAPADGDAPADPLAVRYRLDRSGRLAELTVGGAPLGLTASGSGAEADEAAVELVRATADEVELRIAGIRHRFTVFAGADAVWVSTSDGQVALRERPRFPDHGADAAAGSLTAPLPGTVLRVLAAAGEQVAAGQPLVVLEAMKMEHEITAPVDGTLTELPVAVGDQVDGGQVLAVVEDAGA
ncbi:acetyl-CoA carboxylase biotin carboxyl carrier protein subunit, partial [Patulibacter medicamentivorans]|uniref:acetyl-CoA carboxylase biotin carboxyl carrier protein subunit n=1 Tax=Patulibacter medicamentivorans TaxID=1097667 RepID=UPI00058AD9A6